MANVMLIEGWGLAGTGTDYSDYENNRKLEVLGWQYDGFTNSLSDRDAIKIVQSPESGARYLAVESEGTGAAGAGGRLFRAVQGKAPSVVCMGFEARPGWSSTTYDTRSGAVGVVFSSAPLVGSTSAEGNAIGIHRSNGSAGGISANSGDLVLFENDVTTGTVISPQAAGFVEGIPNWVELVIDTAAGTVDLWVNNTFVVTHALAGSYPSTTYIAAAIGNFLLSDERDYGIGGAIPVGTMYIADERLGRCQVITQRPSTDSAVEFARPQGDSNASQVTDPNGYDGDTTYVSSSTSSAEDLYGTDDPTGLTNERIHGVSVAAVGRKEDIGNRSITPVCAQGTTVAAGDPVTLEIGQYQGTQSVFSADPDTGLDWSLSGLNSSTFGVRLTD